MDMGSKGNREVRGAKWGPCLSKNTRPPTIQGGKPHENGLLFCAQTLARPDGAHFCSNIVSPTVPKVRGRTCGQMGPALSKTVARQWFGEARGNWGEISTKKQPANGSGKHLGQIGPSLRKHRCPHTVRGRTGPNGVHLFTKTVARQRTWATFLCQNLSCLAPPASPSCTCFPERLAGTFFCWDQIWTLFHPACFFECVLCLDSESMIVLVCPGPSARNALKTILSVM